MYGEGEWLKSDQCGIETNGIDIPCPEGTRMLKSDQCGIETRLPGALERLADEAQIGPMWD